MAKDKKPLTREFLVERDLRIFKMRQAGVAGNEIARRFGMTTIAVGTSIRRQLEKLNREAMLAYPEVLRMELERLDSLQQSVWPLTQYRKVKTDDGGEMQIEPDLKAVQTMLSIIDRRAKLLGMDQNNINVQVDVAQSTPIRATLAGAAPRDIATQFSPEAEVRKLLAIMGDTGVMDKGYIDQILGNDKKLIELTTSSEELGSLISEEDLKQ